MSEPARKIAIACGLALLIAVTGAIPTATATPRRATLSFDAARPGPRVPADFLGLSLEVKSLPSTATYAGTGNLDNLLRSLGGGLLRFGGVTADTQVAWTDGGPLPSWATLGLTAADFQGIAALSQASGWRVLLTLNFGHFDLDAAAAEAAAAHAALGTHLAGLAFGNEPDSYVPKGLRPDPWSFGPYAQQVDQMLGALSPGESGLPLAAPEVSSGRSHLAWTRATAQQLHPALLTQHLYPLSWCAGFIPGIADLLSPAVKASERHTLTLMAALSASAAIPLRVDETNNISCGGEPGVSNTFASALWATDFIARAMASGVAGVNFHGNAANPSGYSPLAAAGPAALLDGDLTAEPEWYALLLSRNLLGAEPLPTTLRDGGPDLSAQAFATGGGGVRVVVVDERPPGSRPLLLKIPVPPRLAAAAMLRLTAPAPNATGGVALGGRAVASDGSWAPAPGPRPTPRRHGAFTIAIAPSSAALITLYPRR